MNIFTSDSTLPNDGCKYNMFLIMKKDNEYENKWKKMTEHL